MLKEDSLRVVINQIKPMKDYEKEIGEADFHNAGSLCHGWSAIPLIVYTKYYIDQWLDA